MLSIFGVSIVLYIWLQKYQNKSKFLPRNKDSCSEVSRVSFSRQGKFDKCIRNTFMVPAYTKGEKVALV